MNEDEKNVDEIRRDIEDTRQRISSEIEAIEGRLTPGHAKDVVKEKVSETGHRMANRIEGTAITVRDRATRVRGDFGAAVRENPVPVVLVGVGTGWLLWETFRPTRALEAEPLFDLDVDVEVPIEPIEEVERAEFGVRETNGHRSREIQSKFDDAKERVTGLANEVRERAFGARERVKDRTSHAAMDAKERATHLAHDARDRGFEVAERGRERVRRSRDAARSAYGENPLVFASIALATGVGLGMMLPRTEREDHALGPMRDRVLTRARNMAEKAKDIAIDSVREGTNVARETAKREAEEQHLVP